MATTNSSPFRGAPTPLAGVADPVLSASVLTGGCVAFWRIGLRVSDATVWGMLPDMISAAPAAVFHAARLAGVSINTMKSVPDSRAVPSGGR